jgi:hypothetical protein
MVADPGVPETRTIWNKLIIQLVAGKYNANCVSPVALQLILSPWALSTNPANAKSSLDAD